MAYYDDYQDPYDPEEARKRLYEDLSTKLQATPYNDAARQNLLAENETERSGPNWVAGLGALGAGIAGRDAISAGQKIIDTQEAARRSKLNNFDKARQQSRLDLEAGLDLEKRKDLTEKRAMESDPTSGASKIAQNLAKQLMPNGDFATMSAAQINSFLPSLNKSYEAQIKQQEFEARRREADARIKESEARRLATQTTKADAVDEKKDEKIENDVKKLAEKLGNSQEVINTLGNVEDQLGFKLEDAKIGKDGELQIGGKKKDLPGVSVPFFGRVSGYDSEARGLESAVAKVFNTELKDRSGAAVTTPELERLKTEFGAGKFNTEPELVKALQNYKRLAGDAFKNREAGFRPEVIQRYEERGGSTSKKLGTAGSGNKTVVKKQYSPSLKKTKIIYSDGSEEIVDGR